MQEYLDLRNTELVPSDDVLKAECDVFYLPMHVVYKSSSTTTKVIAYLTPWQGLPLVFHLIIVYLLDQQFIPPLIDVFL